jgi:hypothetical protein
MPILSDVPRGTPAGEREERSLQVDQEQPLEFWRIVLAFFAAAALPVMLMFGDREILFVFGIVVSMWMWFENA